MIRLTKTNHDLQRTRDPQVHARPGSQQFQLAPLPVVHNRDVPDMSQLQKVKVLLTGGLPTLVLTRVPIRVRFRPRMEGGLSRPPQDTEYACLARLNAQGRFWTVVLRFRTPPTPGLTLEASLELLSPTGPSALLRPGTRLTLYEGPKKIGDVAVMEGSAVLVLRAGALTPGEG